MKLLRGASVYLTSNILNSAIPFLLLPILTRYLSTEEYGKIAMFQIFLAGISTLIGCNTISAISRKYFDDRKYDNELKEYNNSCLFILLISSIVIFLFISIFIDQLSFILSIPPDWIYIATTISSVNYIISLRLIQWQVRGEAKKFGILQLSNSSTNITLSLILIIIFNQGSQGRIDAQFISAIIFFLISALLLKKSNLISIIPKPNNSLVKDALSYSIPLLPHTVGVFFISFIDRFIINKEMGLSEAGIYMVGVQLSSTIAIVFNSLYQAYIPWLFEKLKKDNINDKVKIVKYTYLFFIFLVISGILIFIISPIIIKFVVGEQYYSISNIIGWLCLGQLFGGMYLIMSGYIYYSKKTSRLALITISSGITNVILLLIFIPKYGLIGAAISFAFVKFAQFIIVYLFSIKCINMPWFNFSGTK
ncbi:oligosaccharide flippase family protein [Proteus mirabilis]|uniref:lipopolysaccharide biosynthesis protein n=3 Tax=Proteus mirabilis TaxID=584 RepID=UPI0018C6C3A6|nr:oligosaccharide flippase family protein [Proteus mirabilis]ELT0938301.1 oligosaccharide flippase family protein [Proteus mirabilis]MBG2925167.1 oligosaccharide flippase family protein [Proteus mirabilis]MBI6251664.1 oligosaccharide flippase family protein [Proteus mirabilis]MBI6291462.1 oligosaccharide flippase family protein [Proteus mirabilis]MBI6497255.1 oligosaccharide flippase family protein [Proteus mirabilis]